MVNRLAALAAAAALFAAVPGIGAAAGSSRSQTFGRLTALEDHAEAIAGGERTGAAARAEAKLIAAGWPAVRSAFAGDSSSQYELDAVDGEVAALRAASGGLALQRAANETTGALAPLFGAAGDPVPVSVHLLDYLARGIALDARAGEWDRAAGDAANLDRTWIVLRPEIVRHGAPAVAVATDRAVAAMRAAARAHDRGRVFAAASASAGAVDKLEKVFGG
jgi:hypothetical protein